MPRLILASGSPRRRQLLVEAGYDVDVIVPDESAECGVCSETGPAALVAELAYRKAADVARRVTADGVDSPTLLIAGDTVVECQGWILGKPADREHACEMLERLSGREHRVHSGVCVWRLPDGEPDVRVAATTLRMDELSRCELDDYLDSGQWEGKAGAFGYQDRLGWVHIIEGSESNVVGLPMELVEEMIAAAMDTDISNLRNAQ